MHLKSLTLRGFKSFASSTTLQFEPGITCVVGPNGSGKSNVVDALAWVMGEQGAKTLRGGKMEDVVFAGTSDRAPLGRAEVVLTIDNSDGALPVEFAEVTIARTMFRGGGSEYALNGQGCRLLDVQELLNDSGIGREMHVVVGQGQLDSVLHATPEDRRGFIEEAAGVLKHRRRREKAVRKLEATEANLTRVQDLLGEIRRQLKPLGRQAEVARRAGGVQAELRDARARLLADELVTARSALAREQAGLAARRRRRDEVDGALRAERADQEAVAALLAADAAGLARAQETWYRLSALRDRILGTAGLAAERVRAAEEASDPLEGGHPGRDPDLLAAEEQEVRDQEARLAAEVVDHRGQLDQASRARVLAERAHAEEDRRVTGRARALADRREGLARLHGRLQALRSRAAAGAEELARLETARGEVRARAERAQREFTALENQVAGMAAGESGLDAAYEVAAAVQQDLEARLAKLVAQAQLAERERAALQARTDALELGLARKDGAGALLGDTARADGVLGSVAAMVSVRPGLEAAVAAALGAVANAVVVDGVDGAVDALRLLHDDDLGQCGMLLGSRAGSGAGGVTAGAEVVPTIPPGATPVLDVIDAADAVRPSLRRLLADVMVVDGLAAARSLVTDRPDLTAVTRAGDLLGTLRASGGSSGTPSPLEVQAALDDAAERLSTATHTGERLRFDLAKLEEELAEARGRTGAALSALHESDAAMAALAEQLAHLGGVARSTRAEEERLAQAVADAEQARERDLAGLADLERRAASSPDDAEPDDGAELARLGDAARQARAAETEARLALRTLEERARALAGRADALGRAAAAEREARTRAAARREQRRQGAAVARQVAAAAERTLGRLDRSLDAAAAERAETEHARAEREAGLAATRRRMTELEAESARLTDAVHRDELAGAEQRLRLEQLEQRVLDEVGLDTETLVAEFGPDVLVPAGADDAEPVRYDRAEQSRRLQNAEQALALLGKVNPLALEEFAALEERHQFLTEQLEDVRRTRRDLLDIIGDVDDHVQQVFAAAHADVAREFAAVFARLFPGGEGNLVLSDPGDLLGSGVEVEARPAGKRIKRLSLLSGGERSLVAVAFLLALFKARPSPFYILDEVEAALDDTNLGRLLEIFDELRAESQLLVITHQKRTMQIADALYGVGMRDDGVSVVISQRLRETERV